MAESIKAGDASYVSWNDDKGKAIAMYSAGQALRKVEPIVRTHGSNIFLNIAPHTSVRDGFNRSDYDEFRGSEATPKGTKGRIGASMNAYDSVGIVRNIIDLMSDFAVQGLDIVHPNERIEKFYKEWFRRISGLERSERFLNILYRCGNVVMKRQTAKLFARQEDQMRRATAAPDIEVEPATPLSLSSREIPWRYVFLNPLSVDVLTAELAPFIGADAFIYGVQVPAQVAKIVAKPRSDAERTIVKRLPNDIRVALTKGQKFLPLDPDKLVVTHYKRDDWKCWAEPMLGPILSDLQMLEKMKLADLAALDGAISSIRIWKLGSLEAKIMPTGTTINRLAEMLANNVGGGVMDLVWGPDLELLETSTEVHRFLGSTKYEPVLNAIFQGLGIPTSLNTSGSQQGFTNNFVSLKTLIERLEYGRSLLRTMWLNEARIVQKAMGFRFPADFVFDKLLTDEAAEKQLLLNLCDRDLVSIETVQERFGLCPEIEEIRIRRETRRRDNKMIPMKASPFHDPQQTYGLEKIFAQTGVVSPSQVGVELEEQKSGDKSLLDIQGEQTVKQAKIQQVSQQQQNDHQFRTEKLQLKHGVHPQQIQQLAIKKGVSGQGRPKQSRDMAPRKNKTVKPRTSASADFVRDRGWAEEAQLAIAKCVSTPYLKACGKKTLRELTDQEGRDFESFKFSFLCQLKLGQDCSEAALKETISRPMPVPVLAKQLLEQTVAKYVQSHGGREPTYEIIRGFQASVYAVLQGENESSPARDRVS